MASRIALGVATHSLTWSPKVWRRSSSTSGLVGSAVARVTVDPSTAKGQMVYWRRYCGDRFFTIGSADGDEGLTDPLRGLLRAGECGLEGLVGDGASLQQDLPEPATCRARWHTVTYARGRPSAHPVRLG